MNKKFLYSKIALSVLFLAAAAIPGNASENAPASEQNSNPHNLGGWSRSSTTGQFFYTTREEEAPTPPVEKESKNETPQVADGNWGPGNQPGYSVPGGGRLNSGAAYQEAYENSYNSNRSDMMSPTYLDNPRGTGYQSKSYNGFNTNLNREYNTVTDYDYNRSTVNTVTSSGTLSEAQLLGILTPQTRSIYLSLDPEGKTLAIQLASEDSYRDKNLAVREAQRRMNERYGLMNRY